jgi:hypothetical protein
MEQQTFDEAVVLVAVEPRPSDKARATWASECSDTRGDIAASVKAAPSTGQSKSTSTK